MEGQGTLSIKVLKKNDNRPITATVEVTGGPEGCPALTGTETETIICILNPQSILLGEFSIPGAQINKARLDNLIDELQDEPNSQGYIIEYFKPGTPRRIINLKIQKIRDYLVKERKFDETRVTIVTRAGGEQNLTGFWLVPPGAEPPAR